ncbi:MAG: arginase family protein [Bacteroidia bacterium]|nr:arginase family protein [Bacteroidia bacterium]
MGYPEHTIIRISELYSEEGFAPEGAREVDFRSLEGTSCYCSEQARERIGAELAAKRPGGINWIDSGDYHYLSRFTLEAAARQCGDSPFALVLFDHHPDMQQPAFGNLLSCGGWARGAFTEIPQLKQVLLLGIAPQLELEFLDLVFEGVLAVTTDDLRHTGDALGGDVKEMLSLVEKDWPIYISVDLDVLTRDFARTNWDQGCMTPAQLQECCRRLAASHRILGVDICGGITREKGGTPQDFALNLRMRESLSEFFASLF